MDDADAFSAGLLERRLLLNRCRSCGRWHQPPWPSCPDCWSEDVLPTEVSGRGVVHSLAVLRTGDTLGVVELDEQEGLRATALLLGAGSRIGQRVRMAWIDRGGSPVPAFEPE
jgi:uncharacterized OB-fold protein